MTGSVLWANMHLLFWLSLIPFVTAWMGEHHAAAPPSAIYGVIWIVPDRRIERRLQVERGVR